MRKHCKKNH
jgi:hypothetical protein